MGACLVHPLSKGRETFPHQLFIRCGSGLWNADVGKYRYTVNLFNNCYLLLIKKILRIFTADNCTVFSVVYRMVRIIC
jgi:hypothetical protein